MNIGVIGLGFMGATHLRALGKVSGAKLAAIASSDEKKLAGDLSGAGGNLGATFDTFDFTGVKKYRRWEELLEDPEVAAVDITLPTALHALAVRKSLEAGKHVLVEKPIALDGDTADELIAMARERGRILMAAQVLRFFPMYRQMAELVKSGGLGAMRSATFRRRCAAPGWAPWMKDKASSGGGVFDLLIHDVDFALHLFGTPEAVSATGREALAESVDTIQAQLYYPNIDSVTVAGGWHHGAFPFSMEYTMVGETGTIEYSSLSGGPPVVYRAGAEAEPMKLAEVDGFEEELRYFVDCVSRGAAPELCPPEESAMAVRVTRLMSDARQVKGEKVSCRS